MREDLVEKVLVAYDSADHFDEKTIVEKLKSVDIKAVKIQNKDEDGQFRALVTIESVKKEKINEATFPLMVTGLRIEIFEPG